MLVTLTREAFTMQRYMLCRVDDDGQENTIAFYSYRDDVNAEMARYARIYKGDEIVLYTYNVQRKDYVHTEMTIII